MSFFKHENLFVAEYFTCRSTFQVDKGFPLIMGPIESLPL